MRVRVLVAVAVVAAIAAVAVVAGRSTDDGDDDRYAAFCDDANGNVVELSGADGDGALVDALADLQRAAPSPLDDDVGTIVDARRAFADVAPDPTVEVAMALADRITAAEGAPLERLNRALANECGMEERVPAIGH